MRLPITCTRNRTTLKVNQEKKPFKIAVNICNFPFDGHRYVYTLPYGQKALSIDVHFIYVANEANVRPSLLSLQLICQQ